MKKILLYLLLVYSISMLSAVSINIDMKDNFIEGETIFFNYTIEGVGNYGIVPSISCLNAPLKSNSIILENLPYLGTYDYLIVDDLIESQVCVARVSIVNPLDFFDEISFEEKEFSILGESSFSFVINLCKEELCSSTSKTFFKDEPIYLDFFSDIDDFDSEIKLVDPNGKEKYISLPYSFTPKNIGTYRLEWIISKEGYNVNSFSKKFSVLEYNAKIEFSTDSNLTSEETIERIKNCKGCFFNQICYDIGDRIGLNYCNEENGFMTQKQDGESCKNNWECETNNCYKEICKTKTFLGSIIEWFRNIFDKFFDKFS
ncbi:MAG: hypothetical protein OQK82_04160 [Candidatus Pacearchaeota archaeon]|nr:hypothetical protein [Candidatus Pacearchaeota archaeon]